MKKIIDLIESDEYYSPIEGGTRACQNIAHFIHDNLVYKLSDIDELAYCQFVGTRHIQKIRKMCAELRTPKKVKANTTSVSDYL